MSRDLIWRLVREWKLQSLGVLKIFHGSLHDFLAGGPSSREKHLNKFFQFFSQGFWRLVRDSFQSRKSCVLRFKNSLLKKKKISFPSFILTIHCLVHSSLSHKLTVFLTKIHQFSSSSLLQTSRKGMGFLFFLKHFMFITFDFLIFELLLRFEKCVVRIWVEFILLSLLNGCCWYWSNDACFTYFHVCFSFLSSISWLCCVVHIIPMVKCLVDIFLCFWG